VDLLKYIKLITWHNKDRTSGLIKTEFLILKKMTLYRHKFKVESSQIGNKQIPDIIILETQ